MTLLEFLRLHYADAEHPDDGDEQEDESLPFRSVGTLQHIDLNWIPAPEQEMSRTLMPVRQFFHYQEPLCSRIPSGVFHPPRNSA